MKQLTREEVKQFALALDFTESEAKDITELFYKLKEANPVNHWRTLLPLNNVDEYIREWENHWHRETNLQECFEYERECEYSEYDPNTATEIFSNIEAFKAYALNDYVFQLPNNDMVVVVC